MIILIIIGIILCFYIIYSWKYACSNRVYNMIMKMYPNAKNILDFGCGSCCNTSKLALMGKHIVSMDIVDKGVCTKPQLFDGNRIPYADKTFDLGICSFVLHHTSTYTQLLQELKRTCKNVLVIENTPELAIDWIFTRKHAHSEWGTCDKCFKTDEMWQHKFYSLGFNILKKERIPRWVCPFSDRPWLYPVPSVAYLLT